MIIFLLKTILVVMIIAIILAIYQNSRIELGFNEQHPTVQMERNPDFWRFNYSLLGYSFCVKLWILRHQRILQWILPLLNFMLVKVLEVIETNVKERLFEKLENLLE